MQSVNPQEKQININGLNISYKQIGNGDVLIVLLHGWGVDSGKYIELAKEIFKIQNSKFKIQIPDLPGFGKSEEPKDDWRLDDYVEFADKFIEKANRRSGFELVKNLLKKFDSKNLTSQISIKQTPQPPLSGGGNSMKIILIGHSFGGRVAIKYAVKYPGKIDKLILTGAAGIRHKLNAKQKVFSILAKTGKKFFSALEEIKFPTKANKRLFAFVGSLASESRKILYKLAGEKDYYKASLRMKEIMKNVLAEDLTPYLDKIKTSTLLVWGSNDNSTPLPDGKIMSEKIKNSELVVFDGANHSLPYQKPEEFAKVVAGFIKK